MKDINTALQDHFATDERGSAIIDATKPTEAPERPHTADLTKDTTKSPCKP